MPKSNVKTNPFESISLDYYPNFISVIDSTKHFNLLREELKWQVETYLIYGKKVQSPRMMAWYGDNDAQYCYSGVDHKPLTWTNELLNIKSSIEDKINHRFNSVLANLYRNGKDSIGWHSDNEKELGIEPVIASLSLGEIRRFCLRHNKTKKVLELNLENGSLLIMHGDTQRIWQHSLPKTKLPIGERINLTFRNIKI